MEKLSSVISKSIDIKYKLLHNIFKLITLLLYRI